MVSNTLIELSALVGIAMPLLVGLVKQEHWSRTVQTWIALAACVIAAIITTWAAGTLTAKNIALDVAVVWGAAQVTFEAFWKPTNVDAWLTSLFSGHPPAGRPARRLQ